MIKLYFLYDLLTNWYSSLKKNSYVFYMNFRPRAMITYTNKRWNEKTSNLPVASSQISVHFHVISLHATSDTDTHQCKSIMNDNTTFRYALRTSLYTKTLRFCLATVSVFWYAETHIFSDLGGRTFFAKFQQTMGYIHVEADNLDALL